MCQSTLLPASEIGIIVPEQSEGIFQSSCHMLVILKCWFPFKNLIGLCPTRHCSLWGGSRVCLQARPVLFAEQPFELENFCSSLKDT